MKNKIKEAKKIRQNGCNLRHKLTEHIMTCEKATTCPCAEYCLMRAGVFEPEEAATLYLAGKDKHHHDYRTKQSVI